MLSEAIAWLIMVLINLRMQYQTMLADRFVKAVIYLYRHPPVSPIATPISARFNAGASLTPSPVIAMTSLRFWHCSTMSSFCSGVVLQKGHK
jgi:hypothetical protein